MQCVQRRPRAWKAECEVRVSRRKWCLGHSTGTLNVRPTQRRDSVGRGRKRGHRWERPSEGQDCPQRSGVPEKGSPIPRLPSTSRALPCLQQRD